MPPRSATAPPPSLPPEAGRRGRWVLRPSPPPPRTSHPPAPRGKPPRNYRSPPPSCGSDIQTPSAEQTWGPFISPPGRRQGRRWRGQTPAPPTGAPLSCCPEYCRWRRRRARCALAASPPLSPFRSFNHPLILILRLRVFLPDPLARRPRASPLVPGAVVGIDLTGRSPAATKLSARSAASPPIAYPKGVWARGWRGRGVDVTLVTLFRHGDGGGERCHGRRGLRPF